MVPPSPPRWVSYVSTLVFATSLLACDLGPAEPQSSENPHDVDDPESDTGGDAGESDDPDGGTGTDTDPGRDDEQPPPDDGPSANEDSPLGTNLTGLADWSTEVPFIDLFHQARPWISGSESQWDDGGTLDLDENGWVRSLAPGQIARTMVYVFPEAAPLPWDRLIVLYDGSGSIRYDGGAVKNEAESSPGREVIDLQGATSLVFNLTETDSSDPLRNIRIVPGRGMCTDDATLSCDADADCGDAGRCLDFEQVHEPHRFHPDFLERIAPFSTLRFMDWMATNDSPQSSWSERPQVDDATWTAAGAPVEVMVDLANRTGADPWFTLPHLADDDYIRAFATVVRDRLEPSRTVYIEHSNEVWNAIFSQAGYAETRGLELGLSDDPYQAQLLYHSRRSQEIFAIWEDVFGDTERLVRVMGSQAGNAWASEQIMGFESAAEVTDALAIAPYMGGYLGSPERQDQVRGMTVEAILDELENNAVRGSIDAMAATAEIADSYGIPLIAYEGGQHLAGHGGVENDDTINALFDEVNRHPRMYDIYAAYLEGWREHGQLFVHFTDCSRMEKWGRWGALEYPGQSRSEAPKFDALLSFIETTSKWW